MRSLLKLKFTLLLCVGSLKSFGYMKSLDKLLEKVGLPSEHIRLHLRRSPDRGSLDKALTTSYLSGPRPHKLHIGCGFNVIHGWLNSDYKPAAPTLLHLDATRVFPFSEGTFDFIFSEHMIEHVPYLAGCHMLRECFRVLRPGGKIRISTPDLKFLIELYTNDKLPLQSAYIKWAKEAFVPWATDVTDTFVINNFFRDWGHCFIYDEKTLRKSMQDAGFQSVVKCALQESATPELRNLENETRSPPGFLRLETLTLEGTKL